MIPELWNCQNLWKVTGNICDCLWHLSSVDKKQISKCQWSTENPLKCCTKIKSVLCSWSLLMTCFSSGRRRGGYRKKVGSTDLRSIAQCCWRGILRKMAIKNSQDSTQIPHAKNDVMFTLGYWLSKLLHYATIQIIVDIVPASQPKP